MCGIIGSFQAETAKTGLHLLQHRGTDDSNIINLEHYHLGHVLLSLVGHVGQPLQGKGTLAFNGEIYNWKELAKTHNIKAENDAQVLLSLLDNQPLSLVLEQLDGVYAFCYVKDHTLIATRDLLGVKPLYYNKEGDIASESKAIKNAIELNPRETLYLNLQSKEQHLVGKDFFTLQVKEGKVDDLIEEGTDLVLKAIAKRIPDKSVKVGIMLSGGVDSTLIAKVCKNMGLDVTCYTATLDNPQGEDPHDLLASQEVAKHYELKHKIITAKKEEIESISKEVISIIESTDPVKVAVGIPFYLCAKQASKDGCKILFSGLGAEEIMAGYKRHKDATDINQECLNGLLGLHERDLYRDDTITMSQGIELRLPFLDKELILFSLTVPADVKIKDGIEKYLLRKIAHNIGLLEQDAFRPKKAAQYGSRFDRALKKVANAKGLSRKEYLSQLVK